MKRALLLLVLAGCASVPRSAGYVLRVTNIGTEHRVVTVDGRSRSVYTGQTECIPVTGTDPHRLEVKTLGREPLDRAAFSAGQWRGWTMDVGNRIAAVDLVSLQPDPDGPCVP